MMTDDLKEQLRKISQQLQGEESSTSDPKRKDSTDPPIKEKTKGGKDSGAPGGQQEETPNIGWLYNVDYFREVDFSGLLSEKTSKKKGKDKSMTQILLEKKNNRLFKLNLRNYRPLDYGLPHLVKDEDTFDLTTTYPGLLVGSGYPHETKSDGEVKLGFFFDHTSGLPIIPGSSVKGVCRSIFKKENALDVVNFFLFWQTKDGKELPILERKLTSKEMDRLEREIFEGEDVQHAPDPKSPDKRFFLKASQKDVFHDALIMSSEHPFQRNGKAVGKFLANDFLTPHINRVKLHLSQFSDPTPLQFLKVLPKVTFRFQFDLKDGAILNKSQKIKLFRRILINLGVGAKTNVGYGQFVPK